jgi:hypothetical protein
MSAEEKVQVLTSALETIREATYAQFQEQMDPRVGFRRNRDVCPVCGRGSTVEHLRKNWALIHSAAAAALRETEA